jgi:phosphopantetheinyl transferase
MNPLDTIRNSLELSVVRPNKPDLPDPLAHDPITDGMMHIWSARYSDLDQYHPVLSTLICPDEITRAAGFKKNEDARRYLLRHGLLRAILGYYTHQEPVTIRFVMGTTGKPDLDPGANILNIRFSLSHTDEMVGIGISRRSNIGLDIVKIDYRYPFSDTGEYLFSPEERRWIAQTDPEDRRVRFFRIWSLKEALLKATGDNVHMMKEAEVSGIMTGTFLDGFYPVRVGKKERMFFINESSRRGGHHCALAAIPAMI